MSNSPISVSHLNNKVDEIENVMNEIYYNPSNPGSYGGIDRLLREVNRYYSENKKEKKIPRHVVEKFLSSQDAYTLIRPARRRFPRNPYLVKGKGYQFASDLMDLSQFSEQNDGYKWLLIVMDIYSRYVFIRPLRNKSGLSVLQALKSIIEESNLHPQKFETDLGGEYWNKHVRDYLKSINTHHFSKGKSSHVERFIRTFATRLYRYQTKHNTRKYINILQEFVKSYNNSYHRSIRNTPHSVFVENATPTSVSSSSSAATAAVTASAQVKSRKSRAKKEKRDLQVGDLVRLSHDPVTGNIFEKEAYGRWTDEIFIVKDIVKKPGARTLYRIVDQNQEPVKVNFYREELQRIHADLKERLFQIEKILRYRTVKGKRQALVKWRGYPDSFNSWEPVENIKDI
jgi:transposase InsO family protein